MNVLNLSDLVISRFKEKDTRITNLSLQKILYYIQGYFLRIFGYCAFSDGIYAWAYGPAVPYAYYEYTLTGVPEVECKGSGFPILNKDEKRVIDKVIDACLSYRPSQLCEKTKNEDPYKYTSEGKLIEISRLKSYFSRNNPLNIK